jgi:hypothetical protein
VGVCVKFHVLKVTYNCIYSLSGDSLDFLQLQISFYWVMNQRGIRAGLLWINQANKRLATSYRAAGWKIDGPQDYFFLSRVRP